MIIIIAIVGILTGGIAISYNLVRSADVKGMAYDIDSSLTNLKSKIWEAISSYLCICINSQEIILLIIPKRKVTITKDKIGADHKPESSLASYYWQDGNAVYFAKDTETKKVVLTSDKKHLLLDHVKDFTCEKKEDKEKKQKDILHISLQLKNEDMAEFTCDKEVVMRNQ